MLCKAVLEITSWSGISAGAQHYYGSLHGGVDEEYRSVRVCRRLSAESARKLNAQRDRGDDAPGFAAGMTTECFDSEAHVRITARRQWRKLFPNAVVLLEGQSAVCDPQRCIAGPPAVRRAINAFVAEAEKVGWYEGDEKAMGAITDRYMAYVKAFDP